MDEMHNPVAVAACVVGEAQVNATPSGDARRITATVLVLWAVAAAIRVAYVGSVWDSPYVRYPMVDSLAYHDEALSILAGNWVRDGIFYQDPLYPYFLAGLYAIFGPGTWGVLLAQALLDSFAVVLIYATARQVFDSRVALLAGLFACFYKVMFYYDALLLKATLTLFLISLSFFLLFRAGRESRPWRFGLAGFAFGLATLTRGNYLLFLPILLAWPWIVVPSATRRRTLAVVWMAAGVATAVLPVTLRNYAVGSDFVLITSQAGQNFYIGNHRGNRTGLYDAPSFVEAHPFHEQDDFRAEAERRTGRTFAPSELSRFWFGQAVMEIRADPGRFVRLLGRKARVFFNDYEVPDNQSFAFFAAYESRLLRVPMPTFGFLLPLAAMGAVFARRNSRARLLVGFVAVYAGSVILFFNLSRYRIPIVPAITILAGAGVVGIAQRFRAREWSSIAATSIFLGLAWVLVFQNVTPPDFARVRANMAAAHGMRAQVHSARALALTASGDETSARMELDQAEDLYALAEAEFRRALESGRQSSRTHRALRRLLLTRALDPLENGWFERARDRALALTSTYPTLAEGHAILGEAHAGLGDDARAAESFARALALDPQNPRALRAKQRLLRATRTDASKPF